jgi:anti-sigma regulatory factor (Ser/Thr protein kinase)
MCTSVLTGCGRPPTDLEIKLDPVPEAPGEARTFVRRHLPALGFPGQVDDAVVIAAELVTNAVRYAGAYGPIWLSLRLVSGRALLEVQDCCPELPVFCEPDFMAEHGRGLHVVTALAAAFDWLPINGGKIVWAIIK